MDYDKKKNPYTLQFSLVPPQYISRESITEDIIGDLTKDVPTFRGYFITGVRGCGKTAMMADIADRIEEEKEWVTVDIADPESNILDSLARCLYRIPELRTLFLSAKLDFSVLGIGVTIEKAKMVASDENDAVEIMLSALKKKGKKLLVTIDEVTYGKHIAAFSHTMSSYARKGYDIYVLITGLSSNIQKIKNNKSLTFLYRAKEIELPPLNKIGVINDYKKVFRIEKDMANKMAEMTKGYAFAFQVLGYLYWKALAESKGRADIDDIASDYDYYLSEFSYGKIWSETTKKEQEILKAIAKNKGKLSFSGLKEMCNMETSDISVYRERLIRKGIIDGSERGYLSFALPRFSEFIECLWE